VAEALAAPSPLPAQPVQLLPETAGVPWRPRMDVTQLRRAAFTWTLTTVAHVVPFVGVGALLFALEPLAFPVTLAALAHAWIIPELYAQRGANVVRKRPTRAGAGAEATALGLLGDLVGHEARDLYAHTGLVLERGALGVWLVGETGALLVRGGRNGGGRVHCFCVRVNDPGLPSADRTSHLLLALRTDEAGFATVANQAFSGARWRVRRRMRASMRPALDAAGRAAAARAR
jgi:hypothetical protein